MSGTEPPVVVEAGDITAQPRRTGHRWTDLAIALSAILVSVTSLVVAIRQGETQSRLQAASTWPFLSFSNSNIGENRDSAIEFSIRNQGVGPALLKQVRMEYNGKPVQGFPELLQACCGWAPGVDVAALRRLGPEEASRGLPPEALAQVTGVFNASVRGPYAPGERRVFMSLPRTPQNTELWSRLNNVRQNVDLKACYCSALGECWRGDLSSMEQEKVRACPELGPLDYQD